MSEPKFKVGDLVRINPVKPEDWCASSKHCIGKVSRVKEIDDREYGKTMYKVEGDTSNYNLGYWRYAEEDLQLAEDKLNKLKNKLMGISND